MSVFHRLSVFVFFISFYSAHASPHLDSAIEMAEDDIVLLKRFAVHVYHTAKFDRSCECAGMKNFEGQSTIDERRWAMRPFYTSTRAPSAVGAVYHCQELGAVIVAFHGSQWAKDWQVNFDCRQRPACDLAPDLPGKLHRGFSQRVLDSYDSMMDKIQCALGREIKNSDEIYFTGHSLGGALAQISGMMVSTLHDLPQNFVKIVTFSAPGGVIGDTEFVEHATQALNLANVLNFVSVGDVVPRIPQQPASYAAAIYSYCTHWWSDASDRPAEDNPGECVYGGVLGLYIETSVVDTLCAHYLQPLPDNWDDALEHPMKNLFELAQGIPAVIKGYVDSVHIAPADKAIKEAFCYAQSNYRHNTKNASEAGQFSIWSVQRNAVLRFIYNRFA